MLLTHQNGVTWHFLLDPNDLLASYTFFLYQFGFSLSLSTNVTFLIRVTEFNVSVFYVLSFNSCWNSIIGSDHGIKAQGDGWLLTIALIEGSNLAAVDSSGFSDPYVVFTCNGKTRTSSIKFQKSDPLWNGEYFVISCHDLCW